MQEEVGRELAAEVGYVENCRQPGVLLADEVGVFAEAEDCLGAEGGFVGLLDAVAEPHEREQVAVDFAEDAFVLFGREVCFGEDFDGAFLFFGRGEFLIRGEGGLFLVILEGGGFVQLDGLDDFGVGSHRWGLGRGFE